MREVHWKWNRFLSYYGTLYDVFRYSVFIFRTVYYRTPPFSLQTNSQRKRRLCTMLRHLLLLHQATRTRRRPPSISRRRPQPKIAPHPASMMKWNEFLSRSWRVYSQLRTGGSLLKMHQMLLLRQRQKRLRESRRDGAMGDQKDENDDEWQQNAVTTMRVLWFWVLVKLVHYFWFQSRIDFWWLIRRRQIWFWLPERKCPILVYYHTFVCIFEKKTKNSSTAENCY